MAITGKTIFELDELTTTLSLTGETVVVQDGVTYKTTMESIGTVLSGTTMAALSDVTIIDPIEDQILKYSGDTWVNATQFHTFFENYVIVAKQGGNFDKIQDAIDYANVTYTGRTLNTPVVIIVYSGEYREQIHSYENIVIISSAAAYDTGQGQAKATIIMSGDTAANYPLRTDVGDVYYMVGMSIYTDTVDGVLGHLPNGTFKNCSTRYGHFIENPEGTNTQFKDCKFNSNTYGGFNITSGVSTTYTVIKLDRCTHFGTPTFKSTHSSGFGFIGTTWSEIKGSYHIAGDWGIQGFQTRIHNVAVRNTFDTTSEVKFEGGYMASGMHFISAPGSLHLQTIGFESIADNLIPSGETDITSVVHIIGRVQGNFMHNGLPSEIHMNNPDKFVGTDKPDGYVSLKAALDSITDSSSTKRYTIQIAAGVYIEDNPLQAKEYVNVKAIGDLQTTRITALDPNQDLLIMANLFTIEGIALWGVTGATNYAINQSTAASTSVTRCMLGECSNGILLNHPNAKLVANDVAIFNPTVTAIRGAYCQAGELNTFSFHASLGNIGTLIEITGSGSTGTLNDVNTIISTLTTGVSIKDLAVVDLLGAKLLNMGTGIELEGGAHVHMNSLRIENASVDGVRVNDVGTNTILNLLSGVVLESTGFDFNFLSATCLATGTVSTSLNNLNFVDGAKIFGLLLDIEEDDEGVTILGELHVGIAEKGAESTLGEGNSYTRGMLVYSETSGGTFTDRSIEARSASSSSFTFDGIGVDNAIYIASSLTGSTSGDVLEHYGIKTKVLTAAVMGTGSTIIEYWNGTIWVELNGMEVDGNNSYYPHANNYFQHIGGHHIRYDSALAIDSWTKNDPMSGGTDYYWTRIRIVSGLTTAPIFEQFKLHTNRTEINGDGWVEYFGKARPIGQLPMSLSLGRPFEGAMQSQDLYVSQNIGFGGLANKFTATGDILGVYGFLPFDCDTSSPLILTWTGHPNTTDTYVWAVRWAWVTDGDTITYTEPAPITNSRSITITGASTVDEIITFEVPLDVSNMVSRREVGFGDEIWISIQPTTLPANFTLGPSQITYTKWSEGGHI
jgi:hypothetical protein